jgi:spoIIIJ-associated protein
MSEQYSLHGQQWLENLLKLMGIPALVKVEIDDHEPNNIWLVINDSQLTPSQIKLLIGEKGANIDAMQYLVNALLHIGANQRGEGSFTIELAGYRRQRQAELQVLADQIVHQVRETGQEGEIRQLSSAERRQVHSYLQNAEDLITESKGQEPDRRLVVKLRN